MKMKKFINNNWIPCIMITELIFYILASILANLIFSDSNLVAGASAVITYSIYDSFLKKFKPTDEANQ